jgi:hypothetical protein
MVDDPKAIAAQLTEAQRAALIDGVGYCARRRVHCLRAHKTVMWNLCRRGVLRDYIGAPALTPLGLAVRQILQRSPDQ